MKLAKQINEKLDEIISLNESIEAFNKEISEGGQVKNTATGEIVTKEKALNKAQEVRDEIISELNQITNNGQNAKDIFTNKYYINDSLIDKESRDN